MKNTYVKPEMQVEEFLANQYVAACGQTVDGDYIFKCDHPGGDVYLETNGISGLQKSKTYGTLVCGKTESYSWGGHRHNDNCYSSVTSADQHLGGVHPCNKTHKTKNLSDFVDGYVDGTPAIIMLDFGQDKYGKYNGQGIKNYHATKSLTRDQLTIVKS